MKNYILYDYYSKPPCLVSTPPKWGIIFTNERIEQYLFSPWLCHCERSVAIQVYQRVRLCRTTFFINLDAHTRFARSAWHNRVVLPPSRLRRYSPQGENRTATNKKPNSRVLSLRECSAQSADFVIYICRLHRTPWYTWMFTHTVVCSTWHSPLGCCFAHHRKNSDCNADKIYVQMKNKKPPKGGSNFGLYACRGDAMHRRVFLDLILATTYSSVA